MPFWEQESRMARCQRWFSVVDGWADETDESVEPVARVRKVQLMTSEASTMSPTDRAGCNPPQAFVRSIDEQPRQDINAACCATVWGACPSYRWTRPVKRATRFDATSRRQRSDPWPATELPAKPGRSEYATASIWRPIERKIDRPDPATTATSGGAPQRSRRKSADRCNSKRGSCTSTIVMRQDTPTSSHETVSLRFVPIHGLHGEHATWFGV